MTILPFIKKEFNFLTFCFAFENNSWKMTPNATSVSCFVFYWWLMTVTQRKLQRFWTPFLSVNSFQLLWKTCVRWCAWNRVFVSIATLEQLTGLACCLCEETTSPRRATIRGLDAPNFGSPLVSSSSNSADLVGTSKQVFEKQKDTLWLLRIGTRLEFLVY